MNCVEKARLAKLLDGVDVAELKLPEKCTLFIKELRSKHPDIVENEEQVEGSINPYIPNQAELDEIDKKIMTIVVTQREEVKQANAAHIACPDPQRPWRTYTCKEKLLRIDNEIKRHHEKSNELITPLSDDELKALVTGVDASVRNKQLDRDRVQEAVELAKRTLPNFQYRRIISDSSKTVSVDEIDKVHAL